MSSILKFPKYLTRN